MLVLVDIRSMSILAIYVLSCCMIIVDYQKVTIYIDIRTYVAIWHDDVYIYIFV